MIPWVPLAMLVGKIVQNFSGKSGANTTAHPSAPHGNDFERRMQYLSQQTGIPIKEMMGPNLAVLEPRFNGIPFFTSLARQGNAFVIEVYGSVGFPPGGVHPKVKSSLASLTHSDDVFRLSTCDGSKGSFVTAEATIPADSLTPAAFVELLEAMIRRLAFVDAWVLEQGYHR